MTTRTPSTSRPASRSSARRCNTGPSASLVAKGNSNSTRLSEVFTDCPPGPEERENLQDRSDSGIVAERTRRAPGTPSSLPHFSQHLDADTWAELSFDLATSAVLSELLRARALDRLAGRLVDGVLTVASSEHRSQLQNREAAEQRLAQLLREAVAPPPKPRRPTRPTKGSQERRLEGKRQRAQVKRGRSGRHDE